MPPTLQADRAKPRLHVPPTPRLHRPPLLTARAPRRKRTRAVLQSSRRDLEHAFQEQRRHHSPGAQHTIFVLGQAGISMCPCMRHQRSAELHQRLYDLFREVIEVHVAFLDPPLL